MQQIIAILANKYAFDLDQQEDYLELHLNGFMPLVVERISSHQIAVSHYYKQEGDVMRDPEIVFFTGYKEWVPLSFEQSPAIYHVTATTTQDGNAIEKIDLRQQADLASFCVIWARNIKEQGWLERASCVRPVSNN